MSISNSEPTEYRYSGWAYSESPVIRLGLAMKEDGETGYLTLFDDIRLYNPLNEWVYVEKYVTVPAHITSLNLRLECAAWGSKVGNVWWDDVKIEVVSGSEIVEENNYYPFGLQHKGYNNVINGTHHPYGYGGKEENEELGLDWLDFGARNYDASLGRWMNLDPLAEQMRRHSPYNYAFDNPIYWTDPDGMAPLDDYFNKQGEYLGSDNAKTDNVQIVSQKDWDANSTTDDNGKASISQEKGAEISTNITESQLSNDAVENVVEHYDSQLDNESKGDDVSIEADDSLPVKRAMKATKEEGVEIFGVEFGEEYTIKVNTKTGTVHNKLDTASNIKSTLVHEHHHVKDDGKSGEAGAIKAQKTHPSYRTTTSSYKKAINKYEKDN